MKRKRIVKELQNRVNVCQGSDNDNYWRGFRVGCQLAVEMLTREVEPPTSEEEHSGTILSVHPTFSGVQVTYKLDNGEIITEQHQLSCTENSSSDSNTP